MPELDQLRTPAFVAAQPLRVLRRARGHTSHLVLRPPRWWAAPCTAQAPSQRVTPPPTQMLSAPDSEPAELQTVQPSDLTSPEGFALRDAKRFTFSTLSIDETPFQQGGAFAICDASEAVVYMGYTKNIATKLLFHARLQPQQCSSFRVYVPPVPPELISPDMLESVLEYWVREIGAVPRGNTVDRALWEQERPLNRKEDVGTEAHPQASPAAASTATAPSSNETASRPGDEIPVRERTTPHRVSTRHENPRYYSADPFADAFRSSTGRTKSTADGRSSSAGWGPSEEDYIEVDVDPLDPFSASGGSRPEHRRTTWTSRDFEEDEKEDWYPILMIMGIAGLVWLFGILGNALPAATPSVGM